MGVLAVKLQTPKIALRSALLLAAAFSLSWTISSAARADDAIPEIRFGAAGIQPSQLQVPANQPVKLRVANDGKSAIEFESFELHRERVVQPGQTITVFLSPMSAGTYTIFDDFNRDSAKGSIVAH